MKNQLLRIIAITLCFQSCTAQKTLTQTKSVNESTTTSTEKHTLNTLKLDSLFNVLEENDKFMGSITLSQNGKIIYTKAIGFDDIETNKISTINTKYRIGSISKMFTSSLVFKAIEENKLNLNKTIESYFPLVENAMKITIGNLLNHRSGIHNFTNDEKYLTYNTEPKTEKEMVAIISGFKSDFEPNTKSDYSNSNYVLLSIILEKTYHSSFKDLVRKKIIEPNNLKNTYYGNKIAVNNNESYSYKYLTEWTKEAETNMSIPLGAGAIVSTSTDLTKFIEAVFNEKIISKQSLEKMTTIADGYGFGVFQFPFNDKKSFGHTGGIDGFNSFLSYFPKDGLSIALCSNGSNYDNNNIMIGALSCYFNEPFTIPTFEKIEILEADLEQYLGIYSTEKMPIKFTITREKNVLFAQGTGQLKVAIEYKGKHTFSFEQVGAEFDFSPELKTFTLKQGGGEFIFNKE
jgi:CubicO group peptidase (beta-lactamase class C family)